MFHVKHLKSIIFYVCIMKNRTEKPRKSKNVSRETFLVVQHIKKHQWRFFLSWYMRKIDWIDQF